MKKQIWFTIIIFILLFSSIWVVTQNNSSLSKESKVNINYQAVKKFSPDIATVLLGVETVNEDLKTALKQNTTKVSKIKRALTEISSLKITTANYQVRPEEKKIEGRAVTFHKVTNLLKINISDLKHVNQVLEKSLQAGANRVVRIEYQLKDKKIAKEEVINQAIEGLKDKVKSIANKLNRNKIRLITLNVNDSTGRNAFYEAQLKTKNDMISPNIMPGKIEIQVSLRSTYLFH
jgi:uncharacterized protein YggE